MYQVGVYNIIYKYLDNKVYLNLGNYKAKIISKTLDKHEMNKSNISS